MSANPNLAEKFRALHEQFLILPNAWDPGSARLIESCGATAIATTSSGLGWSNGYPDGSAIPIAVLGHAVAAIARVISVPLSVDAEGGYDGAPETVGKNVSILIDNGAVGINLEDGNDPPELMLRKIAAARAAGERAGVALFINARTDVYLHALVPKERMVEESMARAARYGAEGADGIFVPGVIDPDAIRAIAGAVAPLPFNAMMRPGLPAAETLKQLGVRRLSAGGGIAMGALSLTQTLTKAWLATGDSNELAGHIQGLTYPGLNALFKRE
ncbi:MAG TPA: isocitrate lyase/phosphoenolpyruvate mutase family protein [Stellaceae bacterium]